ncbi:MAG TPA: TAXI family TRAP transporter solute-binding subunit, partial [Azospira sp.]|nr:TAXI family TRAP transporter solute-binding subunit [Azospira sp.]
MGAKVRASLVSLRDLLATAWPIMLVVAIGFAVAIQFIKPAPPRHVVMSTGTDSGAYYVFGKKYAEVLARSGITLEVRTSAGSGENLARLLDKDSDVEIALVQGGVEPVRPAGMEADETLPLSSLGSMYYEPVWVFYRGDKALERLHQLAGKRIAVGAEGSGIRGLALQLLAANEVPVDDKH